MREGPAACAWPTRPLPAAVELMRGIPDPNAASGKLLPAHHGLTSGCTPPARPPTSVPQPLVPAGSVQPAALVPVQMSLSLVFPGYCFISWFIAYLSLLPRVHLHRPRCAWPWRRPPLPNTQILSVSLTHAHTHSLSYTHTRSEVCTRCPWLFSCRGYLAMVSCLNTQPQITE